MAKQESLATIRDRYRESSKGKKSRGRKAGEEKPGEKPGEKSRILDEFIAVNGHHRKHGIRLLGQTDGDGEKPPIARGRRIYDDSVREAMIVVWETADCICGKRLKAALPPPGGIHGASRAPRP